LREVGARHGATIDYLPTGEGPALATADAIVAVVGELPYAEGQGDRADLALTADDRALVARAAETHKPVVVLLISGRPMILGDVLEQATALAAVWLPGTEGAGVADVLFGDAPAQGTLPHSWPRSMSQIPITVGDPRYAPLFPYGFGLGYEAPTNTP
jgi:beta-glucosidase